MCREFSSQEILLMMPLGHKQDGITRVIFASYYYYIAFYISIVECDLIEEVFFSNISWYVLFLTNSTMHASIIEWYTYTVITVYTSVLSEGILRMWAYRFFPQEVLLYTPLCTSRKATSTGSWRDRVTCMWLLEGLAAYVIESLLI